MSDTDQKIQEQDNESTPVAPNAKTVLLVEDDLTMIKMYSTKLKMEGFAIEQAGDGEEGLNKAKTVKADLIILDLMIPKLGGMELLARLKEEEKTKNIPVIILSNLSQEQDIKKANELGVDHFLIKSNYTPSQVVKVVKSFFSGTPSNSSPA